MVASTDHWRFELVILPTVAALLAIHAGLRDARAGRPAYGGAFFTHSGHRLERLRAGWNDVAELFAAAVIIDLIYTPRRIAAVRRFGRDRSEADMPRASEAGRSDENDPFRSYGPLRRISRVANSCFDGPELKARIGGGLEPGVRQCDDGISLQELLDYRGHGPSRCGRSNQRCR